MKLLFNDAVEIVKCCGAVDALVVEAMLKEYQETDDVSHIYGYFIGVTERWTDENPYVMDMWVYPRKVPDPFWKAMRHIEQMTLDEFPSIGLIFSTSATSVAASAL